MDLVVKPTTDYLHSIEGPDDLKKYTDAELQNVVDELRYFVLTTIAEKGGHLAASLGVTELTVALHAIFDSPRDSIIWDVGHQAYGHKVLTGRRDRLGTIKQFKGLNPFCKRCESEHDAFGAGHSSTSISAAVGIGEANRRLGLDNWVIPVIGDNAMTAGLAFEGLNHVGSLENGKILVVFNDNDMGIDPNMGALNAFCQRTVTSSRYSNLRKEVKNVLRNLEERGLNFFGAAKTIRGLMKDLFTPGMMYESLGFRYVGPIDGNNLPEVLAALRNVKEGAGRRPVFLHVLTQKGKGYIPAEKDPLKYHGVSKFNVESGEFFPTAKGHISYTDAFANTLTRLAKTDPAILAITAAMPSGTGLLKFQSEVPDQFYDVGIAEQHAVTFAAGLATKGFKPACAIYSTFLQRAYDMIVHDVCLQNLPVRFFLDRGGIVGADGPTHHGVFDYAYMRHIPNMVVMAPKDENELQHMVNTAVSYDKGPITVRYPRGSGIGVPLEQELKELAIGIGEIVTSHEPHDKVDVTLVGIGLMVQHALQSAAYLKEKYGLETRVVNARFLKPLDEDLLSDVFKTSKFVVTIEDHATMGGFGSAVAEWVTTALPSHSGKLTILGYPDIFVEHAKPEQIFAMYGLDSKGIIGRFLHEGLGVSLEEVMKAKLFDEKWIRFDHLYPKGRAKLQVSRDGEPQVDSTTELVRDRVTAMPLPLREIRH